VVFISDANGGRLPEEISSSLPKLAMIGRTPEPPDKYSAHFSGSTLQDFFEFTPNRVMGFWRQHLNLAA